MDTNDKLSWIDKGNHQITLWNCGVAFGLAQVGDKWELNVFHDKVTANVFTTEGEAKQRAQDIFNDIRNEFEKED